MLHRDIEMQVEDPLENKPENTTGMDFAIYLVIVAPVPRRSNRKRAREV